MSFSTHIDCVFFFEIKRNTSQIFLKFVRFIQKQQIVMVNGQKITSLRNGKLPLFIGAVRWMKCVCVRVCVTRMYREKRSMFIC